MNITRAFRILVCVIIWLASCNILRPRPGFEAVDFPLIPRWAIKPTSYFSGMAVSEDWIAVARPNGITAIDPRSGTTLWEKNFRLDNDSPLLFSKGSLAADSSSEIRLVDKSGKTVATLELDPSRTDAKLVASHEQYLFVLRTPSWTLEAYDCIKGSMLWRIPFGRGGQSVNVDPDTTTAYISASRSIRAIEMLSGRTVWELHENAGISTLDAGILYYHDVESGQIVALDVNNQETIWRAGIAARVRTVILNLTILGDMLIVATNKELVALDKESGHQLWTFDNQETDFSPPVEINGVIYVRTPASNRIYAISHADGRNLGYLRLGNPPLVYHLEYSNLYVSGADLIFSSENTIYSYRAE